MSVQGNSFDGFCVCNSPIFKAGLMGPRYYTHSCYLSSSPELPQKLYRGDFWWDPAQWTSSHPSPQSHPHLHSLCLFTSWKTSMLTFMPVQTVYLLWSLPFLRQSNLSLWFSHSTLYIIITALITLYCDVGSFSITNAWVPSEMGSLIHLFFFLLNLWNLASGSNK